MFFKKEIPKRSSKMTEFDPGLIEKMFKLFYRRFIRIFDSAGKFNW